MGFLAGKRAIVTGLGTYDGSLDATRLTPRNAGFGAATGAQAMRNTQVQIRFQF